MRYLIMVLVILISLLLQSTVFPGLGLVDPNPDLLLIFVIFSALLKGSRAGMKTGFFIGLVEDLLGGKYFGLHILSKSLTGLIIGYFEPKIFKENYLIPVIVAVFGTFVHELLFVSMANLIGMSITSGSFFKIIFPLMIYHGVLAPLLYVPFYKFYTSKWMKNSQ